VSPEQQPSTRSRVWPRLVFWLVVLGLLVGGYAWYRSEVARNRLPDEPPRNSLAERRTDPAIVVRIAPRVPLLSPGELAVIKGSAELWKQRQRRSAIAVIASGRKRALLAKVILHSYGVSPGAVEIDPSTGNAAGSLGKLKPPPRGETVRRVAIVLGNEPLDGSTPTLDMTRRALRAVEFYEQNPGAVLVFTGGPTAGGLSEAMMMAGIAASRGVPQENMRLEEKATSTRLNAELTAALLETARPAKIVVISKASHLKTAMAMFRKHAVFKNAEPLASRVTREEIIRDMEAYLKVFDSSRVRARLKAVRAGVGGVD
jgi:uncharacterized SAM-binding protein YcdF (DUF218 family)